MFTHVVLFKVKNDEKSQLGRARELLLSMQGKIPGLRSVEVGLDELHSERSCDLALITQFDAKSDLMVYIDHPVHLEVVTFMRTITERSHTVDFTAA